MQNYQRTNILHLFTSFLSPFLPSLHSCTNTHTSPQFLASKRWCQVEQIHHSDRGGELLPAEQPCVPLSVCLCVCAFGDDLVSQSFTQATLTYGDHTEHTDITLPQRGTVNVTWETIIITKTKRPLKRTDYKTLPPCFAQTCKKPPTFHCTPPTMWAMCSCVLMC